MNKSHIGLVYASASAFLWGIIPIFLKKSLEYMDVFTVISIRFIGAAILLSILVYGIKNRRFALFPIPKLLWIASIGLALNYILIMYGVKWAGAATSGLVVQSGPLMFVLGGFFFYKEKLVPVQKIGFIVVLVGYCLYYRSQIEQESLQAVSNINFTKGVLCSLGAGGGWAAYALSQKRLVTKYPPQQLNIFIYAFSSLVYFSFGDFQKMYSWNNLAWFLAIFLIVNTVAAYGMMAEAVKLSPANKIGVIVALNPIITFIALAFLKNFSPDWITQRNFGFWSYFAVAVILSGALCVVGGNIRKGQK